MRVPLSWLAELVELPGTVTELADVLTMGGHEVEAIEQPTGGTRGVRVLEVAEVARISGSDKLHLVHATDGDQVHEIVCGAANYAPGDRVAGALPGAVLQGDFEIGRRKLFGVTSNGMLASPRELGIGDEHAGIWVLEPDAPLGADVTEWLGLDETVFELDVTPDRGYALSLHGLARDIAALTGAQLTLPEPVAPTGDDIIPVTIDDPERCPRFDARLVRGVQIGPSPAWMQLRLAMIGMRPLNNVVDATNLAMWETGNPVHAYDLSLLAGPQIHVRTARASERLTTLDGVDRELVTDDLVICDADGPVGLAGVMGGEATEIRDTTSDVLIETANFSARTVLRTARRHQLPTEGAKRWERQVAPETAPVAATRVADLVTAHAGGTVVGGRDVYPNPPVPTVIDLDTTRANARLGIELTDTQQAELLETIGADAAAGEPGHLRVTPPAYRPDITGVAEVQEEIVRLYGYEKVDARVPSTGQVGGRAPAHEARRAVRRALAGTGWQEVMPYPFIAASEAARLGLAADDRRQHLLRLVNPLSAEEEVLRTTLLPGLMKTVRRNVNRQSADLAFFEVGRVFLHPTADEPGAPAAPPGETAELDLPFEPIHVGFAATGQFVKRRHDAPGRAVDLYDLLGAVERLRDALGLESFHIESAAEPPYHPGRAAAISWQGRRLGIVGELHPRVIEAFELPARTLAGELRMDAVFALGVRPKSAALPSALPGLTFDVAVIVDHDVPNRDVEAAVTAGAGERVTSCDLFDVFTGVQIGEGRKSLAYRIRLDDPDTQLTDKDEAAAIEGVAESVADRLGGTLRR